MLARDEMTTTESKFKGFDLTNKSYRIESFVCEDGKDTFYKRRVRRALMATLEKDFSYPLADEARKVLEETPVSPDYHQEVSDFRVSSIRIGDRALVLTLEFRLAVK